MLKSVLSGSAVVAILTLSASLGDAQMTKAGVVTTLERRGLVRRSKGGGDGRMVRVALTTEGTRLIELLFPRFNAEESAVASALDPARQDQVAACLRTLLRGLEGRR